MPQVLIFILGLVAFIIGLWLFFGIMSVALAGLSLITAKAVKVGRHPDDFLHSLVGVFFFCAAISITALIGSGFLRIFASLFVEFPQSEETFSNDIVNSAINFGVDVGIGMIAGIVGWRWFPPIIAAALLPLFYLASEWTLWITITPRLWVLFSPFDLANNLTEWLEGIQFALNLIISPGEWGATSRQMLLDGGGSILVFEPFFAMAIIVVAIIQIFLSFVKKTDGSEARIKRSALSLSAISMGVFLGAALIFLGIANGAISPEGLPAWLGVILSLIMFPLQIILFPVSIIAFIVFAFSAFAIFPFSAKKGAVEALGGI